MQYYNVHSHTFTMSNAPEKFLHLYLPSFVASFIDKITNTETGATIVEKLLSRFGGNGGKRYASFLKIGKSKNQLEVFSDLMAQYSDPSIRFVALSMNMERCGAGPSLTGYEGQLEELLILKKRFPDRVLLFLGIDPRWKADGDELLNTVQSYFNTKLTVNATRSVFPFAGIKIYPSMGFYPFDEKLMKLFGWAAANGVPVLSHCNYQGGIFNNDTNYIKSIINSTFNPYTGKFYEAEYIEKKNILRWLLGTNAANNNLNTCSFFMEPYAFNDILARFNDKDKPLKLCLAHFGGGDQIKDRNNNKTPFGAAKKNWFLQIKDMMIKYPGLYTDISYALHDHSIHDTFFEELGNSRYGNRILFGTDFFLTERELAENELYDVFKNEAVSRPGAEPGTTTWDQVAGSNAAAFLKSNYFDGNVI